MGNYDDIEKMFKEIAASLKIGYQKTTARGGDVYSLFYNNILLVSFNTFIDREGKINIISIGGDMTQKPVSWGSYKKEELRDKARRIITVRVMELIKRTN